MAEVLTKKNSPDVSAIIVTDPVQITAYGLKEGDCVTFLKIQYAADREGWSKNGCTVISPSELKIGNAEEYKIGTCAPSLSKCRNSIAINKPGIYQPNMKGVKTTDVVIEAEKLDVACCPGPVELGIDPCGCACHDDPTEPLPMVEEGVCGGPSFVKMAWMFSPYDNKDPAATVEVQNCDGDVVGYVYPTAGPGHTVPVKACTDNGVEVIGFAVNNSASAAQMIAFEPGCGCSGDGNRSSQGYKSGDVNIINEKVKIADVFGDVIDDDGGLIEVGED